MNTVSGKVRIVTLGVIGAISLLTLVAFAQAKKDVDPKKCGIRLTLGHQGNEPMHVTEDSLKAALSKCDKKTYKVRYSKKSGEVDWEEGDLPDLTVTEIDVIRPDTGGASPTPKVGLSASGVHSTQNLAFNTTDDLKAFVSTLQSP